MWFAEVTAPVLVRLVLRQVLEIAGISVDEGDICCHTLPMGSRVRLLSRTPRVAVSNSDGFQRWLRYRFAWRSARFSRQAMAFAVGADLNLKLGLRPRPHGRPPRMDSRLPSASMCCIMWAWFAKSPEGTCRHEGCEVRERRVHARLRTNCGAAAARKTGCPAGAVGARGA